MELQKSTMKIKEKISMIADNEQKKFDHPSAIRFMHSFGLKCDCVGWAKLNLDNDEKIELLKKMSEEAKKQKMRLRCSYEKEITDADADWYFIKPKFNMNNSDYDYDYLSELYVIKGYKILKGYNLISVGSCLAVSESFMNFCKEEEFTGISFAWVNDNGKYSSEPYFFAFSNTFVENPSTGGHLINWDTKFTRRVKMPYCKQLDSMGGNLSLINEIFYSIQFSKVPIMLDKNKIPESDFAFVSNDGITEELIVRKEAANKLIEKGFIKKEELRPVVYYDNKQHDLLITNFKPSALLLEHHIKKLDEAYEKFEKKKKPEYVPTEKGTLTLLRRAKREEGERFQKALKKSILETLSDTALEKMMPYYTISNGGEISDEVEYYRYEEVEESTEEFQSNLKEEEELMEGIPKLKEAVVIGGTANGDTILLCPDGEVMRYDHEDPYLSQEWKCVCEFFYDNLEV